VKASNVILLVFIALVLIAAGYLVATQVDVSFLMPEVAAERSVVVDNLFRFMLGVATVIFLLVEGALVYAVVRFRRREGDESDGKPTHGNNLLEFIWLLIPAIIVGVISVYSYNVLTEIERPADEPLVVEVVARQFVFEFVYPEYGVSSFDLYLPVDQPVEFQISSEDVIHSFWIPAFRLKRDATPGQISTAVVTPIELGQFPVRCAELCGPGHAAMQSTAVVVTQEDFQAWLEAGGRVPVESVDGQPTAAADPVDLFVGSGFGACHTLTDAGTAGIVGPALDEISEVAASRVDGLTAEEYMRQSIVEPGAYVVEGYGPTMPANFGTTLSEDEINILVDYLLAQ
jgi:cytochrome c oxidase subunit 2